CFSKKVLPPSVKGNTPRISNRDLSRSLETFTSRIIAIKTTVGCANRTIGSFYIRVQKHAFPHVNCSRRISRVCTVGMMRIVIIKTTQYHFPLVCFIITIGISKQNQIRALGKIYTFRCELKPYRHLQAIGKDRLFIGLTVAVGILKNKKLVVGFFISGLPVGVA